MMTSITAIGMTMMTDKIAILISQINDDPQNQIWEAKYINCPENVAEATKATSFSPKDALECLQTNLRKRRGDTFREINRVKRELEKSRGNFFWWFY